jgi:hypothetical protein
MERAAPRFFAFSLSLSLALALSACAGVHWQKAGADEVQLAKDLDACRKESQGRFGPATAMGQSAGFDPRFGPPPGPSQADLVMQESQAVGMCMRKKSYVLVPDTK